MDLSYRYLVVDMDDTLLKIDSLPDLWLKLLRTKPHFSLLAFFQLLKGKSAFKSYIASHVHLNVETLPYRSSVIELCVQHRLRDPENRVILASAADESIVRSVADYLKIFDEVIGSKDRQNIKGERKIKAIRAITGREPYAYAGDSSADIPIWRDSSKAFLLNPSRSTARAVRNSAIPFEVIRDRGVLSRLIIKQMRPHQWVKNLLIFAPFIAAHRVREPGIWLNASLAFLAFSLMASAVYVLNDLLDVESDRQHPSKRHRPFASGELPAKAGIVLFPSLFVAALAASSFLALPFFLLLLTYFALNILYSFKLKEQPIIDVVLLGSFYSLRILAGGYATDVMVSTWMLSFSAFFFFGLALVKRYTELRKLEGLITNASRRGYRSEDSATVQALGVGSSLLSIVVLTLYFNIPDVSQLYKTSRHLVLLLPLLLYWKGRIWLLASRKEINDDPVLFAIKDPSSWCVALIFGLIVGSSI